jgi:hypothetical protein
MTGKSAIHSRSARIWLSVMIAGIIAALYCPSLFIWVTNRYERDRSRYDCTRARLHELLMAADRYGEEHHRYPGPSLAAFIAVIEKHEQELGIPNGCGWRDMVIGDAWNRPLVFQWRENGGAFVLRSVGPNGVDEMGRGDDIEVSSNMVSVLQRFRRPSTTRPNLNAQVKEDRKREK